LRGQGLGRGLLLRPVFGKAKGVSWGFGRWFAILWLARTNVRRGIWSPNLRLGRCLFLRARGCCCLVVGSAWWRWGFDVRCGGGGGGGVQCLRESHLLELCHMPFIIVRERENVQPIRQERGSSLIFSSTAASGRHALPSCQT
jgi:hypothetical protein